MEKSTTIVYSKLNQVTANDERKRDTLYVDKWTRFMLMASTQMQGGNRVQWMPGGLMATAEKWHPAFKKANEEFTRLKDRSPKEAKALLEQLRSQLDAWKKAIADYDKAFGGPLQGDLAAAGIDTDVADVLGKYVIEQKQLTERIDAMLIRMQQAVAETDATRAEKVNALKKKIAAEEAAGRDPKALKDELAFAELSKEDKLKKLETEWKEQISLSEEDRKNLDAVVVELKKKLTTINEDERAFLRDHAEPRRKYLLKFGGYNAEWLVGQAATDKKGEYNARLLFIDLQVLGFTPDLVELEKRRTNKDELMVYIKSLTRKDERTGDTIRFLDKGPGISLQDMYLRSQFPPDVVQQLQRPDLQPVSTAMLYELLALDLDKPFEENLSQIIKICTKEENGKLAVQEDRFVQLVTFLLYTKNGAKNHEDANAANPKKEDHISFEKEAKAKLQQLIDDNTLMRGGDGRLYVQHDATTKPEKVLLDKLKGLGITWDGEPLNMLKQIKATGVDTQELGVTVDKLWDETKTTVADAAQDWWEYVRSIPKLAYDPEQDPTIREYIKKQDALSAAIGSIEGTTGSFDGIEKFFQTGRKSLEGSQTAMEKALLPVDIAAEAMDHYKGAETLSDAALYLIDTLNARSDWQQRPLDVRKIAFWLAMNKGEGGLDMAVNFMRQVSASEHDDDARRVVIDAYIADLPEADRTALQQYLATISRVQELSHTDILDEAKNRDIKVKRDALMVLESMGHAGKIGRWHIDDPAKDDGAYIEESLRAILYGNGADAVITAYVTKKSQKYDFNGVEQVIEVEDANLYVRQIQNDLIYKSQQEVAAGKQNKEYELLQDPMEKGLRGIADTLGELWQGDNVDKAKVIAAIVAGLWLMKSAWNKGGLGKKLLVGLPLLMVANTVYKKQTGKDLLGQHLTFMSKEQRGTALERFRRRGAAIDKYKVLGTNAGHEAIKQLTDRDNPIRVEELLAWREQVKGKGHRDYTQGAPANLNTMAIWQHMGNKKEMNDAYEVAFLAFESLCVDVAQLNGMGGDYESIAEQGADFIKKHYVDMTEYHKDDPRRDRSKMPITMLDVIINEARTPGSAEAITEDRTFVEWLAGSIGKSTEYVYGKLKEGYTAIDIRREALVEKMPEYYEQGKDWVFDTYETLEKFLRVTWHKLEPELREDFQATWKFLYEAGTELGFTIVVKGGEAIEFIAEKGYTITANGLDALHKAHERILAIPELHYMLRPVEELIMHVVGVDYMVTLNEADAKKQAGVEDHAMDTFVSPDGQYAIRDVSRPYTLSTFFPVKRSKGFGFEIPAGKEPETIMDTYKEQLAKALYEPDVPFDDLRPSQQRMVLEMLKSNMFRQLAHEAKFKMSETAYDTELAKREAQAATADAALANAELDFKTAEQAMKDINKHYDLAFNTPLGTLQAEHSKITTKEQQIKNEASPHRIQHAVLSTRISKVKDDIAALDRAGKKDQADIKREELKEMEKQLETAQLKVRHADQNIKKLADEEAQYFTYVFIAQAIADGKVPRAPLRPGEGDSLKALLQAASARETIPERIAFMVQLADIRAKHRDALQRVTDSKTQRDAASTKAVEARQEFSRFKQDGLEKVKLPLDSLFTGPGGTSLLTADVLIEDPDTGSLINQVFQQKREFMGVSFEWLRGDVRTTVEKGAKDWKEHMLASEPKYQEYSTADASTLDGKRKMKIASAYARYLEIIALNEILQRATLKSISHPVEGETSHVLHLSVEEADRIYLYLREREGLIRFDRYVKDFDDLDASLQK